MRPVPAPRIRRRRRRLVIWAAGLGLSAVLAAVANGAPG